MFFTIKWGLFNIETREKQLSMYHSILLLTHSVLIYASPKKLYSFGDNVCYNNFKSDSKDVLAEVLLNKKKKPELAKVYAKKLWKRQRRSNVALIRFYRQQRCFCVVLNTAKQWEHVTAQSRAKINWDSSLCTDDHAVILALILKRFLLRLEFLADVC